MIMMIYQMQNAKPGVPNINNYRTMVINIIVILLTIV